MTTFEGVVYGLVHGLTELLPLGAGAHHIILPGLFGLTAPEGAALAALSMGTLLALLAYFRHDWASMISSVIRIIAYRKMPMTVDERIPLFVLEATIPPVLAWYYFRDPIENWITTPSHAAAALLGFGVLLYVSDTIGRKNKGTFDWNWLDALVVGLLQVTALIPGGGPVTAVLLASLIRNYRREAAAKFALFCATPLALGSTLLHLKGVSIPAAVAASSLSWITFAVMLIVATAASLLAIGGLMKHVQKKGMGLYSGYRILVGASVLGWFYWNG